MVSENPKKCRSGCLVADGMETEERARGRRAGTCKEQQQYLDTGSRTLIPGEELHDPVCALYSPPAHRGPLCSDIP
jgi:hypothetical protein